MAAGLQMRIAGFSLNADEGATLDARRVERRLRRTEPGDVILAHMNKPASGTGAGLERALPELQRRGLRFVTLSQAAGLRPLAPRRVAATAAPRAPTAAPQDPTAQGAPR